MLSVSSTGIFHQTLTKPKLGLDKKLLAETVIPYLIPLSVEPCLNLKQVSSQCDSSTVNLLTSVKDTGCDLFRWQGFCMSLEELKEIANHATMFSSPAISVFIRGVASFQG